MKGKGPRVEVALVLDLQPADLAVLGGNPLEADEADEDQELDQDQQEGADDEELGVAHGVFPPAWAALARRRCCR